MYTCWGCHNEFKRNNGDYFCPTCLPKRLRGEIDVTIMIGSGDTTTKGYAGYNNGLGIEIKNKAHWKHEVQKRGLRTVETGELQAISKQRTTESQQAVRRNIKQAFKQHNYNPNR